MAELSSQPRDLATNLLRSFKPRYSIMLLTLFRILLKTTSLPLNLLQFVTISSL
jgi:hypothetical protein